MNLNLSRLSFRRARSGLRPWRLAILTALVVSLVVPALNAATVRATTTVTLTPVLVAGSSTVTSGGSISFTGSGFAASTPITIKSGGYTICSGFSSDTNGQFTTSCTFSASIPGGSQTVTASDGTNSATVSVTVNASLTLTPTSGATGSQVTVTASGFNANEMVNLNIPGYGTLQTNANSQGAVTNFTFTFPYVSTATGNLTLTLTGASSGRQATATFNVTSSSYNPGALTLTPASGGAGTQVTAYATGFTPGETIELMINGSFITSSTANNGVASFTFTYPSIGISGNQTVSVQGMSSGHQASGTFYVTGITSNILTVSPTSGAAGTTVAVSGYASTSYGSNLPITISFGSTQVATAYTGTTGYFSASFVVPNTASGTVSVTASSTSYGYSSSQPFYVVAPQISLGSTTVAPGTSLAISGSGFTPNETVTITLPSGGTTTATADTSGNLSTSVTIPAGLISGSNTISAIGSSSQVRVTASLTIAAPTLTASSSSVNAGSSVSLSGTGFAPGESVTLTDSNGGSQTTTADSQGKVSATAAIAATQGSGTVTYTATGATSKSVASTTVSVIAVAPTAVPTVMPTTVAEPTSTPTTTVPTVSAGSTSWYFASGRTGGGYSEQIAVLNANSSQVQGTITAYYGAGKSATFSFKLPASERGTYDVGTIAGEQSLVATYVQTNLPVAATAAGAHGTTDRTVLNGVQAPSTQWYFADGYTGLTFKESLDLFNPGATSATVQLTWPRAGGQAVHQTVTVPAHTVTTIAVNQYVKNASHGTIVTANQPVVAGRTMVFGTQGQGSVAAQGATSTGTTLYLAEGSTANGFQEFLSVLNPQSTSAAHVTMTFYGGAGTVLGTRSLTIGALQTGSIEVNKVTHASSVAAIVTSDVPVVAERTMYSGSPNGSTSGGTDVLATGKLLTAWAFASGDTSLGQREFEVLYNPGDSTTTIVGTWYGENGQPVQQQFSLKPHARMTIDAVLNVPALPSGKHGLVLQSTDNVSFIAEQALYDSQMQQGGAVLGTAAAPAS